MVNPIKSYLWRLIEGPRLGMLAIVAGIVAGGVAVGTATSLLAADEQADAAKEATKAGNKITKEQVQIAGQARDRANVYQQPYFNQGTASNNKLSYLLGISNRVDTPVDSSYGVYLDAMTTDKSGLESKMAELQSRRPDPKSKLAELQSTRPDPKNKKAFGAWKQEQKRLTQQLNKDLKAWQQEQKQLTKQINLVNTKLSKDSNSDEFRSWQNHQPTIKTTETPIDSTYGSLLQDNPEKFDFEADPGYQHRLEQGNNALSNRLAGMGMLDSGAAVKEAVRYNQGEATQTFGDAWQRYLNRNDMYNQNRNYKLGALSGMGGSGQQASGQMSQNENNYGAAAGAAKAQQNEYTQSNINAAGNARSAGYIGVGNAFQSGAENYLTYLGRTSTAKAVAPPPKKTTGLGT